MARPPYLPQQLELASLSWRQGWFWDIQFDPSLWIKGYNEVPKIGSTSWFPAVEVAPELYVVRDYEFTGGLGSFQVPSEYNPKSLRVSFVDIDTGEVQNWLEDWHKFIFPYNKGYVRRLSRVVMGVKLAHLNSSLNISHIYSALVYPTGSFQPIYDSSSSVPIMIVQFVVAGFGRDVVPI